jgi:hypothetical protein
MSYSERTGVPVPTDEVVGRRFWEGFVFLSRSLTERGYLAYGAPHECSDRAGAVCGTDTGKIGLFLYANAGVRFPLDPNIVPPPAQLLDAVEALAGFVAKPALVEAHDWMNHQHFGRFDKQAGLGEYGTEINTLFARCGHPYEFRDGRVERRGPPPLHGVLAQARYRSGDPVLDSLLAGATRYFMDPDPAVRRDGLEKLWDAWERLKSVEEPSDKARSIAALLEKAEPDQAMRERLDKEARELTEIGNKFQIRHKEVGKYPIGLDRDADYLFYRLFGLMYHLMRATSRVV